MLITIIPSNYLKHASNRKFITWNPWNSLRLMAMKWMSVCPRQASWVRAEDWDPRVGNDTGKGVMHGSKNTEITWRPMRYGCVYIPAAHIRNAAPVQHPHTSWQLPGSRRPHPYSYTVQMCTAASGGIVQRQPYSKTGCFLHFSYIIFDWDRSLSATIPLSACAPLRRVWGGGGSCSSVSAAPVRAHRRRSGSEWAARLRIIRSHFKADAGRRWPTGPKCFRSPRRIASPLQAAGRFETRPRSVRVACRGGHYWGAGKCRTGPGSSEGRAPRPMML